MVTANGATGDNSNNLVMQVNLFVSGRSLRDLDTFSKSDPMCIVFEQSGTRNKKRQINNNSWHKIGQTEQMHDTLNPDFRTSFTV